MTRANPEQYRLLVAAHEIGHLIAAHAGGLTVIEIRLTGHGRGTEGYVRWTRPGNMQGYRALMIALLAGRSADLRWCTETGTPVEAHGCREDVSNYRRMRREWPRWWDHIPSDRELTNAANRIVRREWARLARLAPRLAERGRLPAGAW